MPYQEPVDQLSAAKPVDQPSVQSLIDQLLAQGLVDKARLQDFLAQSTGMQKLLDQSTGAQKLLDLAEGAQEYPNQAVEPQKLLDQRGSQQGSNPTLLPTSNRSEQLNEVIDRLDTIDQRLEKIEALLSQSPPEG